MRRIIKAIRQGRIPRSRRHMQAFREIAASGVCSASEIRRAWIAANFWLWGKPNADRD